MENDKLPPAYRQRLDDLEEARKEAKRRAERRHWWISAGQNLWGGIWKSLGFATGFVIVILVASRCS